MKDNDEWSLFILDVPNLSLTIGSWNNMVKGLKLSKDNKGENMSYNA